MQRFGIGGGRPSMDPMERKRQKSVIKRKAINFTKIVSLVGIRHAIDSQNSIFRRIVWILWLLFGAGFAFHQIYERTEEYTKYLLRPEVRFVIDQPFLQMPQITICNDNPTPKAEGKVRERLGNIDALYKKMKEDEKTSQASTREHDQKKLKQALEDLANVTGNWTELSKRVTLSAKEAVSQARFEHKDVEPRDVITDMGRCYAFSTKEAPLKSSKAGSSNGLYFVLDIGHDNQGKYPGYKMLIHDPHEQPRLKDSSTVISIAAQTTVRVAILYENVVYEGPPYFECNKTGEKAYYRKGNCLGDCDDYVLKRSCRCRDLHMKADEYPLCSYGEILSCTLYFRDSNTNSSGMDVCSCQPECNTSIYKTSTTHLPVPESATGSKTKLSVSVFYSTLAYVEANNVPAYGFLALLADVGGALSLLLGATLLTVYEVFEFIVLVFKDYFMYQLLK